MPFGKVCTGAKVGNETLCDIHGQCHPEGCNTLAGAPRRVDQGTQPGEGPTVPHPQGAEGYPCKELGVPPIS